MGSEAWLTLGIVALMILGLVQERLTPDAIVLGAVVLLLLLGILEPAEALGGFASPSMLTVGALFVIAGAMRTTGLLHGVGERLLGRGRSTAVALLRLTGVTSLASAFVNNTPIVAMLMPAVLSWATRAGQSPSKFLIPLSYAAIVGGVCTLIGTSTNLVVNAQLEQSAMPGFGMFELAWVGLPCALVALLFLAVLAPRLLPERLDVARSAEEQEREYLVEMRLLADSPLAGRSIEEAGLRHLPGLFLVRIERESEVIGPVGPEEKLQANDQLTFAGVVETIVDLQRLRGLVPVDRDPDVVVTAGWRLHEIVLSPGSRLVGLSIRDAGFRGRYNAAVVAVHRRGERIRQKIGDIVMREGDVLLLEAAPAFARTFRDSGDFYLLSQVEDSAPTRHERRWWAAAILVGVVGLTATGVLPIVVAALGGAMGVIALRCLTPAEARSSIDASVLIVIAAALGIAQALQKTGAAAAIAGVLVDVAHALGPVGVLAAVYIVTMILTELITNNAAAALVFPIAVASAAQVDADPRPFAIAVAVAASLSLATPLGYQTNLMVYGPGGYRFTDFLRIGIPLQLLLALVALASIRLFFL